MSWTDSFAEEIPSDKDLQWVLGETLVPPQSFQSSSACLKLM